MNGRTSALSPVQCHSSATMNAYKPDVVIEL
jgi:hypothetical protein